ncbi:MAG: hypothetical protein A3G93_09085 [Nitrospinae bacterium RIFCSPLOWO2_12_FULL_45_22]|nr:MAG: hypothetical protein A3G93_09085 [Nitrospinae bacterium RIFCSPLOWO2_12_FULL_45_22]
MSIQSLFYHLICPKSTQKSRKFLALIHTRLKGFTCCTYDYTLGLLPFSLNRWYNDCGRKGLKQCSKRDVYPNPLIYEGAICNCGSEKGRAYFYSCRYPTGRRS